MAREEATTASPGRGLRAVAHLYTCIQEVSFHGRKAKFKQFHHRRVYNLRGANVVLALAVILEDILCALEDA